MFNAKEYSPLRYRTGGQSADAEELFFNRIVARDKAKISMTCQLKS
jgi:hypothetical protein